MACKRENLSFANNFVGGNYYICLLVVGDAGWHAAKDMCRNSFHLRDNTRRFCYKVVCSSSIGSVYIMDDE